MKKAIFTLLIALICGFSAFAQDFETYTALKVGAANTPAVDGTVDNIWKSVTLVPCLKVPEVGGEIHPNITQPAPTPADFSISWGMIWNSDGMYFLLKIVDDKIMIVEDYYTDNSVAADYWWVDDNINILFSKDLVNNSFEQWEFAYQEGVDQEEKLTSSLWAPPQQIDENLVKTKWSHDGTTWYLETFINWDAFADGNITINPGMKVYFEVRGRDDDDGEGVAWTSMYHWSTVNYNAETDGIGLGEVTLSATEVQPSTVSVPYTKNQSGMELYPSVSDGSTQLMVNLAKQGNVSVAVYDMTGKRVNSFNFNDKPAGNNIIPLNLASLQQGMYILNVSSASGSGSLKYVKK
jgi:hypothetical protein